MPHHENLAQSETSDGAMSKLKRQHYVPQFYLERFARRGRLCIFDKADGRIFVSTTKNVACSNYFYDVPDDVLKPMEDAQRFEKALSQLEGTCAAIFKRLLDSSTDERSPLSEADKRSLAYYITVQIVRTQRFKSEYLDFASKTVNLFEKLAQQKIPGYKRALKYNESRQFAGYLEFLLGSRDNIIDQLCEHIWIVWCHEGKAVFLTSDNPVAMYDPESSPLLSANRILGDDIEICFPLSPSRLLVLLGRNGHKRHEKHDNSQIPASELLVNRYNLLQIRESERYVFSCDKHFDLAKNLRSKFPELLARPELCLARIRCRRCGDTREQWTLFDGRLGVDTCLRCGSSDIEVLEIL